MGRYNQELAVLFENPGTIALFASLVPDTVSSRNILVVRIDFDHAQRVRRVQCYRAANSKLMFFSLLKRPSFIDDSVAIYSGENGISQLA